MATIHSLEPASLTGSVSDRSERESRRFPMDGWTQPLARCN